jgi:hypothetical protein
MAKEVGVIHERAKPFVRWPRTSLPGLVARKEERVLATRLPL